MSLNGTFLRSNRNPIQLMKSNAAQPGILGMLVLLLPLLSACAGLSHNNGKEAAAQKPAKVEETAPQPGDRKVVEGVEYVYGRNIRYDGLSGEPLYVWIRKEEYRPGIVESITDRIAAGNAKEREAIEKRIADLEAALGKDRPLSKTPGNAAPPRRGQTTRTRRSRNGSFFCLLPTSPARITVASAISR